MTIAVRLRQLRDQNRWTVADMAERTGIPKRTLDKYMSRSEPSLPGFDAICALSRGLGVSLDWLILGDAAGEAYELVADIATYDSALIFAETMLSYHAAGRDDVLSGEKILGLSPEEWAADLAARAADKARDLVASGTTRQQLLTQRFGLRERLVELASDRAQALIDGAPLKGKGK